MTRLPSVAALPTEPEARNRLVRSVEGRPSDFAQGIAALVPALPEQTAVELLRLLGHSIAAPAPAEIREARLGLLLDMVATGTGEVISVEDYERERQRRQKLGERWPAHSTLIGAYATWLGAVGAAMALHRDGTSANVPAAVHHRGNHIPYRRRDVLDAIGRCHRVVGGWPSEWEYFEWARLERLAARDAGKPARLPGRGPIRKLFGSFSRAVDVARGSDARDDG